MASQPRAFSRVLLTALTFTAAGAASHLCAQALGAPTPPPPITIITVTPGDPGDPGNPPGSPGGPGGPEAPPTYSSTATTAPAGPKDMKDVKDMKSSITYHTSPNDYFEFFISGSGTHGDMGHPDDLEHFYFDRAQGNGGLEYHFASDWTVGLILSYAHIDSNYGNINASTTNDSYVPTLFASYYHNGWWGYLSTSDGYDTFTEQRGTPGGVAEGGSDGWQYGGMLEGGYLFQCGSWSYGPMVNLHGYELNASGFKEDGGNGFDLAFDRQTTDTLQSQIGGLVRYDTDICGVHIQPYFSASWQREYMDASQFISGHSIATGAAFSGDTLHLDRDAALIDLGARAKVTSDVDVFLGYEGTVGGNWLTSTAEGGVSISF